MGQIVLLGWNSVGSVKSMIFGWHQAWFEKRAVSFFEGKLYKQRPSAFFSFRLGPQAFIQQEGLVQFLLAPSPKQLKSQVIPSWNHDS